MFTGLVETLGEVYSVDSKKGGDGVTLCLRLKKPLSMDLGDSLSVDGCCLTLINKNKKLHYFDLSRETLSKTRFSSLKRGQILNLERALRLSSRLGGHLVSGHIDCTGSVIAIKNHNDFRELTISIDKFWDKYLIQKGSITINGVSLTINKILSDKKEQERNVAFSLMIIPKTLAMTNISTLKKGDAVNIECDHLVKIIETLISRSLKNRK